MTPGGLMKPLMRSLLAVAGAFLLPFCGSNLANTGGSDVGRDGGPLPRNDQRDWSAVMDTLGNPIRLVAIVVTSGAAFSVTTRSDVHGNFTVSNVPPPYDASVIADNSSGVTISVGANQRHPDPCGHV